MKYKFTVFLTLLFVILLCPGTVSAAKTTGKWVFIGDSYCTVKPKPLLTDLIISELKLRKANCITNCKGGYGFGRKGHKFSTLVQSLKSDRAVTNVLIYGGIYNDSFTDKKTVEAGFRQTVRLIRKKFPKARIWYAAGNWSANRFGKKTRAAAVRYQKRILDRMPAYQNFCKLYKVTFLKDVMYTLRTYSNDDCFIADGHHPSPKGKRKLAAAIAAAIKKA